MKLPKQWINWAECAGIKPERKRNPWKGHYMIGLGRRWRVNCYGEFQCSCSLEAFDRWANSVLVYAPMPTSRASFVRIVHAMNKKAKEMGDGIQESQTV